MIPLPYEITELMVQVFGRSFHFKDNMDSFLIFCGVNRSLVDKYRDEPKFVWSKRLMAELAQNDEGRILQRKILTELCKLRKLPDENVPDIEAGLQALKH